MSKYWFLFHFIPVFINKFRFVAFFFDKNLPMFETISIFTFLFVIIFHIDHFIRTVFSSQVVICNKLKSFSFQDSFSMFVSIFEISNKNISILINNFSFSLLYVILESSNIIPFLGF